MFEHRNPWIKQNIVLGTCAAGTGSLAVPANDTGITLESTSNPATPAASTNGFVELQHCLMLF